MQNVIRPTMCLKKVWFISKGFGSSPACHWQGVDHGPADQSLDTPMLGQNAAARGGSTYVICKVICLRWFNIVPLYKLSFWDIFFPGVLSKSKITKECSECSVVFSARAKRNFGSPIADCSFWPKPGHRILLTCTPGSLNRLMQTHFLWTPCN